MGLKTNSSRPNEPSLTQLPSPGQNEAVQKPSRSPLPQDRFEPAPQPDGTSSNPWCFMRCFTRICNCIVSFFRCLFCLKTKPEEQKSTPPSLPRSNEQNTRTNDTKKIEKPIPLEVLPMINKSEPSVVTAREFVQETATTPKNPLLNNTFQTLGERGVWGKRTQLWILFFLIQDPNTDIQIIQNYCAAIKQVKFATLRTKQDYSALKMELTKALDLPVVSEEEDPLTNAVEFFSKYKNDPKGFYKKEYITLGMWCTKSQQEISQLPKATQCCILYRLLCSDWDSSEIFFDHLSKSSIYISDILKKDHNIELIRSLSLDQGKKILAEVIFTYSPYLETLDTIALIPRPEESVQQSSSSVSSSSTSSTQSSPQTIYVFRKPNKGQTSAPFELEVCKKAEDFIVDNGYCGGISSELTMPEKIAKFENLDKKVQDCILWYLAESSKEFDHKAILVKYLESLNTEKHGNRGGFFMDAFHTKYKKSLPDNPFARTSNYVSPDELSFLQGGFVEGTSPKDKP